MFAQYYFETMKFLCALIYASRRLMVSPSLASCMVHKIIYLVDQVSCHLSPARRISHFLMFARWTHDIHTS